MLYDLSDFEWSVIEPLLPTGRRGMPIPIAPPHLCAI
jgi:transposase